ncbi:methyl-accepting chemotaxis protein [Sphingomonas sp. PAMC 26621]|uniref:methyl-accepting chemotaxis protein n=1 Tax=Sphingomonas sp. PAMC 26621 TaxID=1112213 RepID=UPI0011114778|nr:methyl-accepting chemotaxis protein [Sphingomonas sp. PAMC 26621]
MNWFKSIAPIRLKLLLSFGSLTCLTAVVAISGIFIAGPNVIFIAISLVCMLGAAALSLCFREAISGPYIATVVRMEALADNDLTSPIEFADYHDCVGRMTKAMVIFKDAAAMQIKLGAEAESNADSVRSMSDNMKSLANGDLTAEINCEFPSAFASLKSSFNEALTNLRGLISGVTESAEGIRTGSYEIAQASEDLARRTEGSAASLEETSAALVQIDTRLKATALSSGQTVSRADQAIATVGGGRATAEEAVQAMGRVSDSAKGIDSVIEGLDKIAFQTRVLAMNAAVEAGRAGDAGRGFAVVADLVSALAMRAEEEAKRARDQLTLTQTDIVTAVQAVQKVDGALANISSDVSEVHKLLGTMADDATAQSTAITQITAAISAMDQSTQQNAAMVEETSAAARNLTTEVTSLAKQAAMFKTEDATPVRRVPRAAAPAQKKAAPPYRSPVKALPAMALADGAGQDNWNAF